MELRKQFDHPILKTGYSYEQEIKRRFYLEKSIDKKQDIMQFTKIVFDNAVEVQDKLEKMQGVINREKHGFNVGLINDEGKMEDINFEQYIINKDKLDSSFCYLRSNKLIHPLPISEKIQKKVDISLKELGVNEKLICTNRVVDIYDKLKNNLIVYLSLKKHLEKKERERKQFESLYESNMKSKNAHNQNNHSHKNHTSSASNNIVGNIYNNSNHENGKNLIINIGKRRSSNTEIKKGIRTKKDNLSKDNSNVNTKLELTEKNLSIINNSNNHQNIVNDKIVSNVVSNSNTNSSINTTPKIKTKKIELKDTESEKNTPTEQMLKNKRRKDTESMSVKSTSNYEQSNEKENKTRSPKTKEKDLKNKSHNRKR